MWFIRFKQALFSCLLFWLLAVIIQTASRVYLFLTYVPADIYSNYQSDILRMFLVGGRFDIRIASGFFAFLLLIAALLAIKERYFLYWTKLYPLLATIGITLISGLSVVNVFYYKTYEKAIDSFIFGLIDDDTKAILITLWQDYPVVSGGIIFVLSIILIYRVFIWWQTKCSKLNYRLNPWPVAAILTLVVWGLVLVGVRGSVGTFPLRQSDAQISEINILNALTPSAGMAMDWAYKDYKNNNHFDEAPDDVGRYLLSSFFNRPTEPDLSVLISTTRDNPVAADNPPHIVLLLMESMGHHLLTFDNPERDIFGKLRPHWQKDIVFKRFMSEGDGTIDSLSRLLVRSPMETISQSMAQNTDFRSNMLKPYLQNGYKIIFVTSGNGAWRNLNRFLPHLGASEFIEQNTLKRLYPEAELFTWGLADEYMLRYIEQRLQEAEKANERLLIIGLSATFHPPYRIPEEYIAPTFVFQAQEQKRLARLGNSEELNEIFGTLHYTNDRLGEFIDWVKSHPLKENTIIAITGDHNIRGIGYLDLSERVLGHAVPFYLYLPNAYRQEIHYDPMRVGSHKDIWPTLYNLSLSDSKYYQTGCDLLAAENNGPWCFGYNPDVIIDRFGAYVKNAFLPWAESEPDKLSLAEAQPLTEEQEQEYDRRRLITPLLKWQLERQVHGGR